MTRYLLRRILSMIPVGLGVTFLLFSLLYLTPGDPARIVLGDEASEESIQEFRREHHLDRSLPVRYGLFIYDAVVHQDMGRSFMTRRPVINEVVNTFPVTLKLATGSIVIATVLGLGFGIVCAVKQYSIFDNISMVIAMLGISVPLFYLGLLLILWFSVRLQWLPSSGFDTLSQRILPWITLSATSMSIITRMTRSSMLEVIRSDYIRTARAKGQAERVIILKHALRNALMSRKSSLCCSIYQYPWAGSGKTTRHPGACPLGKHLNIPQQPARAYQGFQRGRAPLAAQGLRPRPEAIQAPGPLPYSITASFSGQWRRAGRRPRSSGP